MRPLPLSGFGALPLPFLARLAIFALLRGERRNSRIRQHVREKRPITRSLRARHHPTSKQHHLPCAVGLDGRFQARLKKENKKGPTAHEHRRRWQPCDRANKGRRGTHGRVNLGGLVLNLCNELQRGLALCLGHASHGGALQGGGEGYNQNELPTLSRTCAPAP